MIEPRIQVKRTAVPPAGTGWDEQGNRVLVVSPPADDAGGESGAEETSQRARELLDESLRLILTGGHRDAMAARIGALLVLTGGESINSASKLAGLHRRTIKRAVATARAELRRRLA